MWLPLVFLLPWLFILCGKKKDKDRKRTSKEVSTPSIKVATTPPTATPPAATFRGHLSPTPSPSPKPENESKETKASREIGSKEIGSKEVGSKEMSAVKKEPVEEKKAEQKKKEPAPTTAVAPPTVEELPFDEQAAFLEARQADVKKNPVQFGNKDSPYPLARRIYKSHECQNPEKNKDEADTCRICAAFIDYSAQIYLLYKKNEDKNAKKNEYPAAIMDIENDFYDYLGKLSDELLANEEYQKSVEWRKEVFASEHPRQE